MAVMIAGFEVDFTWLLQAVMHERAFKVTTTYPFPCMIFALCRSAGVPIWHIDQLKTPQGTVDVGLIRDEANELAPHRRPRPELPPLADDLADTVAQAHPLHRRPLTLPWSSLSRVVAQPRAPLAQPLYRYWYRLLGSKNRRHKWPLFCIISSRGCRSLLLSLRRVWRGRSSGRLLRLTSASMPLN